MPPDSTPPPARELLVLGLWLLETPFEPATTSVGALFDAMIEAAHEHMVGLAETLTAGRTPHERPRVLLPPHDLGRRREQLALRRAVLDGRLPGCPSHTREVEVRCTQAILELTHLRRQVPPDVVLELAVASSLLAATARACESYRRTTTRLRHDLIDPKADRARVARLATRAERDILRRFGDIAQSTYGVGPVSAG